MGDREYENPYDDYTPQKSKAIISDGHLHPAFLNNVKPVANALLEKLNASLKALKSDDYSVYTGSAGIALLYFLISKSPGMTDYLKKATNIIETCIPNLKNRRVSFLNGDSGPLALGAVLYHCQGMKEESASLVNRVKKQLPQVLSQSSDLPDEVLYGRAGYLHALLFINKHINENTIEEKIIRDVVLAILNSGQTLSKREKRKVPLMYIWHEKYYLGAAHGIAGILFLLLQARKYVTESELKTLIQPTIDYVQELKFSSGNFPSSLGNGSDRLIQWCHGAPGVVDLFLLAHKIYGKSQYMETALRCGDVVWERGILKKSYGICHGVAGNAYTFISLYQATKDPKHLYRASKFAEWCTTYGKYQNREPDRPLSLFEGLAGAVYFLTDIQSPKQAKFPAYVL